VPLILIDCADEISAIENDPFKDMARSDRTNSFPQVPAAHVSAINTQPLHTEVEEIILEAERPPTDLFADDSGVVDDFFSQTAVSPHPEEAFGVSEQEPDFEQARFEEGLPLVQPHEHSVPTPAPVEPFFAYDGGEDGDDFFTQVSQSEAKQSTSPPQLERKSTVQVINNLNFGAQEQSNESIPEENPSEDQSPLEKTTGGGIAASKSTIMSEILGELDSSTNEETDHTEEDLAAKWKAALAGDEFLDEDDDLLLDDEPSMTKNPIDPAELFGSDDEGFLDDIDETTDSANFFTHQQNSGISAVLGSDGQVVGFDSLTGLGQNTRPGSSSNRYLPPGQGGSPQPINPYTPTGPQFTDLSRPGTAGSFQPPAYGGAPETNFPVSQPQPRPDIPKAQSFANQAKGGYSSPYDLPMDVLPARKRPSMAHMKTAPAPVAPPRSSSMNSPLVPPPLHSSLSGTLPPGGNGQQLPAAPSKLQQGPPTLKSKSSFFEELPMTSRPKFSPRNVSAPVVQAANTYPPPPGPSSLPPPQTGYEPTHQASQTPQTPAYGQGLVAPERVSPYASLPAPSMTVPSSNSRYSPAPPNQAQDKTAPPRPTTQSRYSPAPPSRQVSYSNPPLAAPQPPFLSHQPRTSSPLAQFSLGQQGGSDRRSSSSYESSLKAHHLPPTREVDEDKDMGDDFASQGQALPASTRTRFSGTPPPQQGLPSKYVNSPPKPITSNYLPQGVKTSPPQPIVPPRRSQTQSPGALAGRIASIPKDVYPRPASVEAPESPRNQAPPQAPVPRTTRPRGFSHGINYIAPTDGRELDSMQRWRGGPVFAWGVGGTIVTSFPKDVPRYGMNQTMPMMLRSPGEVKIKNFKDIDPLPDRLASFPGPLKGKSKKKETVLWLSAGIEILEKDASYLRTLPTLSHDDKRIEERVLLWKILRVFIDNDGILEGNLVVDKAVRAVLSPGLDDEIPPGSAPLYATGADLSGISQPSSSAPRAEPVDPTAVDQLRKHLLRGDREKAVWDAVDKRLWAHAMLISNTVSRDLYKQVCQEFVQKEVKNIGDNTESLAALYEIFAGNLEESIDELVPPSARAGFQMVNTSGTGGPSKDALDGLDRWRETLGLVLSNRSVDDNQALDALGKLLSGYGRAEAAHICFLFARSHSIFGGIDLPTTSMVLVGSDHLRQPFEFDREMEPILLSEVFEYGMSLSSTSNVAVSSPHLSIYKLQHALILAEYGYREKALEYCESIASSMHSQTRTSPYHHPLLNSQVEDLTKRLKQSPKDSKSGWISKPSVEKVSSSFFQKFNSFVAGDDSDNATPDSAANGESGPFARISGGTPTISRSPSNSDLYGSYNGGIGINGTFAQTAKTNRYAPGGSHTPPSQDFHLGGSSYGSQPRSSLEGRSSGEYKPSPYEPVRSGSDYMPQNTGAAPYSAQFSPSYGPTAGAFSPLGNGFPTNGASYSSQPSSQLPKQASNIYSPLENTFSSPQTPSFPPVSQQQQPEQSSYEAPTISSYEPPTSGYQPYEPPAYEPDAMNDEDSPVDTKPKKKSFMDDDEDDYKPTSASAASASEKTKAEKDREADEAFRKAAEADGTSYFQVSKVR